MIEKIGKYRILERIGRGGMGTVFKAHDPILDRLVALKVISGEVDVTEELKARFYREARACAQLNHPNVIIVYDLGEDDGRLYIVMEFLEGEELKHVIAQRKGVFLEDKLSLMIQVCDGLHYAHQKGIIHRDVKPGNIFVLRTGQAKILDFGIARLAASDSGLTRTGLIMGTLRYMSPEQARGRVDYRSDIFSVGAVFYELLVYRPAFPAEDTMELLEQLRSEDPALVTELDPTIPPELAAIIERALRKDPAQRFQDLAQMRAQIELVRRRLIEEAERLQVQVRVQLEQVRELQAGLAARLGESIEDETMPLVDERARLMGLRGVAADLASQVERLRTRLQRAESLEPVLARAVELMQGEDFDGAVAEFERMLRDMPEHRRALNGLQEARSKAEAVRRRRAEVARLLEEAQAAHAQGEYARCLTMLGQITGLGPLPDQAAAAARLRQAAEAALAEAAEAQRREARRREAQEAEGALERLQEDRADAGEAEAARYALPLWTEAETLASEGRVALGREAYAEARQRFEQAAEVYERAKLAAHDVAEGLRRGRLEAEDARDHVVPARQEAEWVGAVTYAPSTWTQAEAHEAAGLTALAERDYATARARLREARESFGRAAREARAAAEAEARERA
ncbi:MAG: protein kinase domain-containing protein, partial [Candidatus Rokuibacteriota bacterium]